MNTTTILTPEEVGKLSDAELKTEIGRLKDAVKSASLDEVSGKASAFYTASFRALTGATGETLSDSLKVSKRIKKYGDVIAKEFRVKVKTMKAS
jgi:hypothetical protein